jgi:hypothetical protein
MAVMKGADSRGESSSRNRTHTRRECVESGPDAAPGDAAGAVSIVLDPLAELARDQPRAWGLDVGLLVEWAVGWILAIGADLAAG